MSRTFLRTRALVRSQSRRPMRESDGLVRPDVPLERFGGVGGDEDARVVRVLEHEVLADEPRDLARLHPDVAADAVLGMDDQVAGLQLAERGRTPPLRRRRGAGGRACHSVCVTTASFSDGAMNPPWRFDSMTVEVLESFSSSGRHSNSGWQPITTASRSRRLYASSASRAARQKLA